MEVTDTKKRWMADKEYHQISELQRAEERCSPGYTTARQLWHGLQGPDRCEFIRLSSRSAYEHAMGYPITTDHDSNDDPEPDTGFTRCRRRVSQPDTELPGLAVDGFSLLVILLPNHKTRTPGVGSARCSIRGVNCCS